MVSWPEAPDPSSIMKGLAMHDYNGSGWDSMHSRLFSGLIVISAVNIIGVLSDPVLIYTVVQIGFWTPTVIALLLVCR